MVELWNVSTRGFGTGAVDIEVQGERPAVAATPTEVVATWRMNTLGPDVRSSFVLAAIMSFRSISARPRALCASLALSQTVHGASIGNHPPWSQCRLPPTAGSAQAAGNARSWNLDRHRRPRTGRRLRRNHPTASIRRACGLHDLADRTDRIHDSYWRFRAAAQRVIGRTGQREVGRLARSSERCQALKPIAWGTASGTQLIAGARQGSCRAPEGGPPAMGHGLCNAKLV